MALSASLEDVKWIDTYTKDTVSGYIRQCQSLLPSNNIYYTIPSLVIHWCLLYYFIGDAFDPNSCGKGFELSNNNKVMVCMESVNGSVYLTKKVDKGIHKWSFKLIQVDSFCDMAIGVWKVNNKPQVNKCIYNMNANGKCYGWHLNWGYTTNGDDNENKHYGETNCVTGDIVDMILDLDKMELRYCHNTKDYGVAFQNIEKTAYKAVVSTNDINDSVELISYQQIP